MGRINGKILRRQGDLLFKAVDRIPSDATKAEGTIVAYGEHTGHKHNAKGGLVQLYKAPEKNKYDLYAPKLEDPEQIEYIDVKQDTVMEHEEHNKVALPKGLYAVVHEREYDPFAEEGQQIRQVLD